MEYNTFVVYIRSTKIKVTNDIVKKIAKQLAKNRTVLWLVSGGSNIDIEVSVLKMLELGNLDTGNLTIIAIDERYGKYDHKDSNSFQLRKAGFRPKHAKYVDVLDNDLSFEDTIKGYEDIIRKLFSESDYIVGQFGLGVDGHIAGVKPSSPASDIKTKDFVIGYRWSDFERLTLSATAFSQVNEGYLVALGANKKTVVERLMKGNESDEKLPASLLNKISDVYVYNSYIESEA